MTAMTEHKHYILEKFVPALNMGLLSEATVAFTTYCGSACRQTAILIAYEMSQRMPEQSWHVFEGIYTGSPRGKEQMYDHAWVWSSGGIFIDANHRRAHRIWETVTTNAYPPQSAFARRWKEIRRMELSWETMLDDTEYYTRMTGRRLHSIVRKMADSLPCSDFDRFDSLVYEDIRPEWMDA